MQRTRWLLIGVLALASAGCARRDWVNDLVVLTDVTGTWEGSVKGNLSFQGPIGQVSIPLVLQQTGPKVTGKLSWSRGQGRVEGIVNGEVLTLSEGIKPNWRSTVTRCGEGSMIVSSPRLRSVNPAFSVSGARTHPFPLRQNRQLGRSREAR